MNRRVLALSLLCWAATAAEVPNRNIEITLERAGNDGWRSVSPRTVFVTNDEIRFRFRSTRPGYLYVLNQSSDGAFLWLYPTKATGLDNRIEADQEYQVPATGGAFRIPPTPGYDTVYWIVSEEVLKTLPELPDPVAPAAEALIPRCRGELLRARGPCEDSRAGPQPLTRPELLPHELTPPQKVAVNMAIKEAQGKSQITIRDPVPLFGYEFVIAHR